MKALSKAEKVRRILAKTPNVSAKELAKLVGTTAGTIYAIKHAMKYKKTTVSKKRGRRVQVLPVTGTGNEYEVRDGKWQTVAVVTSNEPVADNVNHPAHYKVGGIETIDFIEAKQLNYNLGNVVKYITRADHKGNRAEDLSKARWYLNREIAKLTP